MRGPQTNSRGSVSSDAYATTDDFERVFTEDMGALYLLSFLLTGSPDEAEECFAAGMSEAINGNPVFKEWARSWARRATVTMTAHADDPGRTAVMAEDDLLHDGFARSC